MNEVQKLARGLRACRAQEQAKEQALRSALDLSLSQGEAKNLAGKVGVAASVLSEIRHGRRGISTELLEKLCEVQ